MSDGLAHAARRSACSIPGTAPRGIRWLCHRSALYPYTIAEPSSFRYVVLTDTQQHRADYFFPDLGHFTTNVNIAAPLLVRGMYPLLSLTGMRAHDVRMVGSLSVHGHRVPLIQGTFRGLAGRWLIERVTFIACGRRWSLIASYDVRDRALRPLLLTMLRSMRLSCS